MGAGKEPEEQSWLFVVSKISAISAKSFMYMSLCSYICSVKPNFPQMLSNCPHLSYLTVCQYSQDQEHIL